MTTACAPRAAGLIACRLAVALLAVMLAGCAAPLREVPRMPSHAYEQPEQTLLGQAYAVQLAAHPGRSGFHVLDTGPEALQMRASLADAAQRTLDLQTYSVGDDRTTHLLLARIAAAAQRGVRVRILLDDVHAPNREFAFRALVLHPGIDVRLFNPFRTSGAFGPGRVLEFLGDSKRLNRRMHNKLWVADNAMAVVGGRNLGDEYFDSDAQANFSDLDLLAVGPAVQELSRGFDDYWNSTLAVPFAAFLDAPPEPEAAQRVRAALETRLAQADATPGLRLDGGAALRRLRNAELPLIWARARVTYDRPDKPPELARQGIPHAWPDAGDGTGPTPMDSEVIVVTPYFIPSEAARRHLGEMRERGVRVAVLTNSLASTDAPAAHAGYARYRAELLRSGVELYELRPEPGAPHPLRHRWRRQSPSSLHAKIVVVDRTLTVIGSMNQDPRSRRLNTEALIAIHSPELAARAVALFDESTQPDHAFRVQLREPARNGDSALVWITEEQRAPVRYESEPLAGGWMRFWTGLLSIVVPEDML